MFGKLKVEVDKIKEYINLIILVPALLGGFWQILELASIETSYIRFFSLSQLAADGLLILFVFSLLYFPAKLGLAILRNNADEDSENGNEEIDDSELENGVDDSESLKVLKKTKIRRIVFGLLSALLSLGLLIFAFVVFDGFNQIFKDDKIEFSSLVFGIPFAIIFSSLFLRSLSGIAKIYLGQEFETRIIRIIISQFSSYIAFAMLILALVFLLPTVGQLRNTFILPGNLNNLDNLNCLVKTKHPDLKKSRIRYFNDNYIFVKLSNSVGEESIAILKFEELFIDNCNQIEPAK